MLANTGRLEESLPWFEKAHALGYPQAAEIIQQVQQMMRQKSAQPDPNDRKAAYKAFQGVDSLDEMRQVVERFPVLKQMISQIQELIELHMMPKDRAILTQRLEWLQQIVTETTPDTDKKKFPGDDDKKPGFLGRLFGKKGK